MSARTSSCGTFGRNHCGSKRAAHGGCGAASKCRLKTRLRLRWQANWPTVVVSMNSGHANARTNHGFWVVCGCAFALYLGAFWFGFWQPTAAGSAAVSAARCNLVQKHPLFVGFGAGMSLDDFEPTAAATREIWRTVRSWVCENPATLHATGAAAHSPRMHLALHRRHALRLEEVQFDDAQGQRAHVMLLDLDAAPRGWHVHVEHTENAWQVTHAADRRLTPPLPALAR